MSAEPSTHATAEVDDFFRDLERRRTQALVERDLAAVAALHAHDYQLITPAGVAMGRDRYLEHLAREPFYAGWTLGEIAVCAGTDMAIVRYIAVLRFPSGRERRVWHTDAHEKRAEGWQAVWSQATACPEPEPSVSPA